MLQDNKSSLSMVRGDGDGDGDGVLTHDKTSLSTRRNGHNGTR